MSRRQVEDVFPLSLLQEALLFQSLAGRHTGQYVEQLTFSIEGTLDVARFQQAWRHVIDRHGIFRSDFDWHEFDEPVQVVYRHVEMPFMRLDWREYSREQQATLFHEWIAADRRRGFRLDRTPLLRLTLFQMDSRKFEFVWTWHHILLDGWSIPLVLREVFELYQAFLRDRPPELPSPLSNQDYARWLRGRDLGQAEQYWRDALRGFTRPTLLTGGPSLAQPQPNSLDAEASGIAEINLSSDVARTVRYAAREIGVTLHTLMSGTWALILGAYTSRCDVVFGVAISGRMAEVNGMLLRIGMFVNTLPLRAKWSPDSLAVDWLRRMQSEIAELQNFGHAPLARVQRWSEMPPGSPLFESLLLFENYPLESLQPVADLRITSVRRSPTSTHYPLSVSIRPTEELSIGVTFDVARFTKDFVQHFLNQFVLVLTRLAEQRDRRLYEVEVLLPFEREQILTVWNQLPVNSSAIVPYMRIETRAQETPERTAILFEERTIRYRELLGQGSRIAAQLSRFGIGPESRVAVCSDRGPALVAALLGVWKSGGAYVPLDPAHSQDRLDFILNDSHASVLLCSREYKSRFGAYSGRVLDMDSIPIHAACDANRMCEGTICFSGANAAYVMYTSGSSGYPKGVVVSHDAIAGFFDAIQREIATGSDDCILSVTSFAFDISVLEMFLPLTVGACVVLVRPEVVRSARRLSDALERFGATVMQATPAVWQLLVESGWRPSRTMKIICGGERLSDGLAFTLGSFGCPAWNVYGPTEATIWATGHRLSDGLDDAPIGKPLVNTQVYLLDEQQRPMPRGAPGELYIAGKGLAREYLGRPDLTADRFLPNPFSSSGGERMYRTGDLGRHRSDGTIEFLGRVDRQIKIRGYRVEPGEIESVLQSCENVNQAAVTASHDEAGIAHLVAFVTTRDSNSTSTEDLLACARERLPAFMSDIRVVILDSMPRNPNGKTDYGRLSSLAMDAASICDNDFESPNSATERALAEIWREVLRANGIGRNANFFVCGGDSILAMRTAIRAAARGIEIEPEDIFQCPTIARLARRVESRQGPATNEPQAVAISEPLAPKELDELATEIEDQMTSK